jgi:N-hydroxyarylamine O-acetyltransferase
MDVYYKRALDLDIEKVYAKVVKNRRGGFCYELNLLFNWLLTDIGFSCRIIAARTFDEQDNRGPEFDHMSVYVETDKKCLVDVGYGDLFVTPLEIKEGIQWDGRNYFRIDKWNEHEYLVSMSPDGVAYKRRYTFSLDVVKVEDFDLMCIDKQVNPESYFVKNVVCTKPTGEGRVTIFNSKLIERTGAMKIETSIDDDDSLRRHLKEKFGIVVR